MLRKGLLWIALGSALSGALVLEVVAVVRARANHASAAAWNAELERSRTADRLCRAAMRGRKPEAEAEEDVRRGIVRPIFLGIGDDVREIVAPRLENCTPRDFPSGARSFPASCAGDLAGPNPAVTTYAGTYNRRLQALAPRQVAAACGRPSRPPEGNSAVEPASHADAMQNSTQHP